MPKKKTHDQFIDELRIINPKVSVLEQYVNTNTKVQCRCLIDGYMWSATPHSLLQGTGCPKCGGTLKKTHEEFLVELKQLNNTILVMNKYIDMKHKIECKCLIDSHEWEALPQNLLKGHGCPKCSAKRASELMLKSHNDFILDIQRISPSIKIINTYQGNTTKIECICKICGNIWTTLANNLIAGKGCPECKRKKISVALSKSHEQFVKEMKTVNEKIEVLGRYINSNTHVLCRCKVDENIWMAMPLNLLRGTGCPLCNCSHGEDVIARILKSLNISYIAQYSFPECKNKRVLPFDFYLPDLHTCIEYDGEQHFRPVNFGGCSNKQAFELFDRTQKNDAIKNRFCEENDIKLLRIKYSDYNNIHNIIQKISF